jgi:hypothetical protein
VGDVAFEPLEQRHELAALQRGLDERERLDQRCPVELDPRLAKEAAHVLQILLAAGDRPTFICRAASANSSSRPGPPSTTSAGQPDAACTTGKTRVAAMNPGSSMRSVMLSARRATISGATSAGLASTVTSTSAEARCTP